MEQDDCLTGLPNPHHPNVPRRPLSCYRNFFCHHCKVEVRVCSYCDRNQIYCQSCAVVRAKLRKKKANKKYRTSERGKRRRRVSNLMKRARQEGSKSCVDRGSPPVPQTANPISSVVLTANEPERVSENEIPIEVVSDVKKLDEGRNPRGATVLCSFCGKSCSPYQRFTTGERWRKEKRKYEKWYQTRHHKPP